MSTKIKDIIGRINSLLKDYGFDSETITALSIFDPEFRAELLEKLCAAIGEFIDLLAQPDTNEFGYNHNTSVKNNGINHTIYKIMSELELIGRSTSDDKSAKRQKRYKFLEEGTKITQCMELFSIMCNYLNGGNSGNDQYSSPLVVTLGGGNLITIFAQLLDNITSSSTQNNLILPFKKMLNNLARIRGIKSSELLTEIKTLINARPKFRELIKEIANGPRSDLDFKLAPNIAADRRESSKTSAHKDITTELQFILARLKVSRLCQIAKLTAEEQVVLKVRRIAHEKKLKSSCYSIAWTYKNDLAGKFDDTILKNLYTGQMKKEYLDLINDLRKKAQEKAEEKSQSKRAKNKKTTKEHIDNCYQYLLQLLLRKEYNDKATRHNVDVISRMFAYRAKSPRSRKSKSKSPRKDDMQSLRRDERRTLSQSGLKSPKSTSDSESPRSNSSFQDEQSEESWSHIEAETLIRKIRTYTIETNEFIRLNKRMRDVTTETIDNCFKTMSSLMKEKDGLIINLISDIIGNFITEEKFKTAEVLQAIHSSYGGKSVLDESKVVSPSYTPTPASETEKTYDTILTPIQEQFQRIISTKPYNRGLKILLMVLDHKDYSSKADSSKADSSKAHSSKADSSKADSSKAYVYSEDEIDAMISVLDEYNDDSQLTEKDIDDILAKINADSTLPHQTYTDEEIDAVLAEITREQAISDELLINDELTKLGGGSKKKKARTIATLKHKKHKYHKK